MTEIEAGQISSKDPRQRWPALDASNQSPAEGIERCNSNLRKSSRLSRGHGSSKHARDLPDSAITGRWTFS